MTPTSADKPGAGPRNRRRRVPGRLAWRQPCQALRRVLTGLLIGGVLTLAGTAQAAAVAGPGGTAQHGRRLVLAAPTLGAEAATLDLIEGRIEAVDAKAGVIMLAGKPVPLHPTQLRVVAPGGQPLAGVQALSPGMRVRFALEPELRGAALPGVAGSASAGPRASAAAPPRSIVLLYIDAQP